MIIAMVTHMSGGRYDDRPWAPPGVPFEVPDEEGEGLIRWHHAVWLADSAVPAPVPAAAPALVSLPAETAAGPVPDVSYETRAAEPGAPPAGEPELAVTPKPADPKSAWIDYAVSQGESREVATDMTKADLMSRYGGRI